MVLSIQIPSAPLSGYSQVFSKDIFWAARKRLSAADAQQRQRRIHRRHRDQLPRTLLSCPSAV